MGRSDRFQFHGRLAVASDLLLATILAAFLAGATEGEGDAIPRPLALGLLFMVPGAVGWFGVKGRRRSLLVSASALCLVASILSFALVTLVMFVPAVLFAAAAGSAPRDAGPRRLTGMGLGVGVTVLVLAAGWALLLGLTTAGCWSIPGGEACGSGLISVPGVIVAGALSSAAIAVAALAVRRPTT